MSIQDYHYYEAKNQRDSKMLNFVFKITFDEDGNIIQKFNKKHFLDYFNDVSELFFEVCNSNFIRDTELENITKRFFILHLDSFSECLKKGKECRVDDEALSFIVEKFLSINFGAFISGEYIAECLMERIGGEIDLLQFESLVPLLKKLENAQEITLDYSDTDFRNKIIFLHKLGIIDHLRKIGPFNMSVNKLAECLSAILGENVGKIQRPLSDLVYDEFQVNKNNPLKNQKKVNKVEQKLIKIGVNKDSFFS